MISSGKGNTPIDRNTKINANTSGDRFESCGVEEQSNDTPYDIIIDKEIIIDRIARSLTESQKKHSDNMIGGHIECIKLNDKWYWYWQDKVKDKYE